MNKINSAAFGGEHAFVAKDICGPQSAVFVEGERINRRRRVAGVYDAQGEPLPYCDIKGDYLNAAPAGPIAPLAEPKEIDGPVLFAGLACEQFGHVILNSLGRLWALEHLPRETTLLFHARTKVLRRHYKFIRPILNLLGIDNPFVISRSPVRSEQLYTATDLFGERYDGFGDPAFFGWLDSRLPNPGPIDPGKRIYVTRTRLGVEVGRYACEDHLERLLEKQGYDVFAPEQHDLQTQIDVLGTAGRLIFAEGSALHLYGLIRRPEQRSCVIQRRPELPFLITNQVNARPGPDMALINVVRRTFWPPRRSDHYSVSLLDFRKLKRALAEAGMIDHNAKWKRPSFEHEHESLHAGLDESEKMLDRKGREEYLAAFRKRLQEKQKGARKASRA